MSAARADPDTIASAVANKTNFLMTFPITFPKTQSGSNAPEAAAADCTESTDAIWNLLPLPLSKKDMHLPTF
jgi:hypothetical protein